MSFPSYSLACRKTRSIRGLAVNDASTVVVMAAGCLCGRELETADLPDNKVQSPIQLT